MLRHVACRVVSQASTGSSPAAWALVGRLVFPVVGGTALRRFVPPRDHEAWLDILYDATLSCRYVLPREYAEFAKVGVGRLHPGLLTMNVGCPAVNLCCCSFAGLSAVIDLSALIDLID